MNTCKNCLFFKQDFDYYPDDTRFGVCESGKIIYKRRSEVQEKDVLCYQDYENYRAYHFVGEDFGCIHFEEKK